MKAHEFELLMSDVTIPTYIRNIAQKALSTLRVNHEGIIEVNEHDMDLLCKFSRMDATKAAACRFIRIYDELDNSVDIQTPVDYFKVIFPQRLLG